MSSLSTSNSFYDSGPKLPIIVRKMKPFPFFGFKRKKQEEAIF